MIQDIAPHRYDNTYVIRPARPEDHAICCSKAGVLLCRDDDVWALPRFRDGISTENARHLFAIDDEACFLADAPEAIPAGMEWANMEVLRTVRPMEVAFAAVTGNQLRRWYRDRAFCPRCGKPMAPGATERSMVCPACGLIEYPKLSPVVIVAVTDGDRIVITRYANRPYHGGALIAGYVEIGETLEDTVRREVMEEVGLKVKNIRYYKSQPWSFTDTLLMGFYCELDGDDSILLQRSELSWGEWVHRKDLKDRSHEVSMTAEMVDRFRRGEV